MLSVIEPNTLNAALSSQHVDSPKGTHLDLEIDKESGRVSRYRQFRVYLPANYTPGRQYPLLMVLHGCRQDHTGIQAITGFDSIADRVGAIVVYPFVTTYSGLRTQNCWGWWLSRQRQRGRGEVSDLRRIAEDVSELYSVDPARRYICGLSSGGAMSVACLAAYSDFWAKGASVAGVPYGESTNSVRLNDHMPVRRKSVGALVRMLSRELVSSAPPLLIVQMKADRMVGPKLGANLRDSWVNVSGCSAEPCKVYANNTRGYPWSLEQYCIEGSVQVAHFLLEDLDHGWPGGAPGKFSFPQAPNVSELIWRFLSEES